MGAAENIGVLALRFPGKFEAYICLTTFIVL